MAKLTKQQRKDNADRAARGNEALQSYIREHGEGDDHTTLTDLLADLMHLAEDRHDDRDCPLDWDDALRMARMHFEAEIKGEQ